MGNIGRSIIASIVVASAFAVSYVISLYSFASVSTTVVLLWNGNLAIRVPIVFLNNLAFHAMGICFANVVVMSIFLHGRNRTALDPKVATAVEPLSRQTKSKRWNSRGARAAFAICVLYILLGMAAHNQVDVLKRVRTTWDMVPGVISGLVAGVVAITLLRLFTKDST